MKQIEKDWLVWLNGEILPSKEATLNVLSPTAQYGINAFEGIRCYWNPTQNQLYAFRLDDHITRLKESLRLMSLEDLYSVEEYKNYLIEIVRANDYREDISIRQTVFLDGKGNWSSKGPTKMFISPIPKSRTDVRVIKSVSSKVSSWERISDRNMPPRIKAGANYMNSRLAQIEALEAGYDSAIFLNRKGTVAEGPGASIFIVKDGCMITPPSAASVLESITKKTVMEIATNKLNIKCMERDIDRTELYLCDEAFFCGSAVEILPIKKIDNYVIGTGDVGLTSGGLLNKYMEVVNNEMTQYSSWVTPIYKK